MQLAGAYADPEKIKTLKSILGDPLSDPDSLQEAQRRLLEMTKGNVFGDQAGGPSFDITGGAGDKRRMRRNLSPGDVERLMQEYPNDAEKIRQMYLPGPQLPKAEIFGNPDVQEYAMAMYDVKQRAGGQGNF